MPSKPATARSTGPATPQALSFGAIVLVPFAFTSQAASKQRPAVIVSSRAYNVERPDLIMMAVTSQLRPTLAPAFEARITTPTQASGKATARSRDSDITKSRAQAYSNRAA